jgi:hypothetical protein
MSGARTIGLIVGGIVVLIGASIAVVLLAGNRGPQTFPSDSPEAALQVYLKAWDAGDEKAAYAVFSKAARRAMSFGEFQRAARQWRSNQAPDSSRTVLFERSEVGPRSATVFLIVEERYGEGLSGGSYRSSREVRLVREGDAWKLADPLVWLEPAEYFAGPF